MNLPGFSVRNPVVANLLMLVIVVGGIASWFGLQREFFPNLEPDQVFVTVPYPGATPEEVEQAVALPLERELRGVDDLDEIETRVYEGVARVVLTMEGGADRDRFLNDVRNAVDLVEPDLPEAAEDPEVIEVEPLIPVVNVVVYGDVRESLLRETARRVRDDLLDLEPVSRAALAGVRDPEIWIEAQPEKLEAYGLTFEEVGAAVARANVDVPGGSLEAATGNLRVRTMGERERTHRLEEVAVASRPDGGVVRVRDVARVERTFEDVVEAGRFRGLPAVMVVVQKSPDEDALEIAAAVKDYVARHRELQGGAVRLDTILDLSRFIEQRLDLMTRNARVGLILVLLILAFFLELRVALWTAAGLPIAFLGTFLAMHLLGESINLISLFGLIVVLGMLVDDAIVIGENVFARRRAGMPPAEAAERGAREVGGPVFGAVLTTMVAFLPLAFIEGRIGDFLRVLPVVVICALGVSLLEAFVILPAHLAHSPRPRRGAPRLAERLGERKHAFLEGRMPAALERVLRPALRWRYVTVTALVAAAVVVAGLVRGGSPEFVLLQDVDAENVEVNLEMAAGTPEERTADALQRIADTARAFPETASVFGVLGTSFGERGRVLAADPATVGQLTIELLPADEREARGMARSRVVVEELRRVGERIPGVSRLEVLARAGGPGGNDIEVRLRGEDLGVLRDAAAHVRGLLSEYEGVTEIQDDYSEGKLEVRLSLRRDAEPLGLATRDLAGVVRHALFGFRAQQLQEEDEEVDVRVLLPERDRRSIADLRRLRVRTPSGARVPLEEVADLEMVRGPAALARVDGKRAVTVTAQVEEDRANTAEVTADLARKLEDLGGRFRGVTHTFEGEQKETRESLGSLRLGFPAALFLIYTVLAIQFRSYFQPALVMFIIPFGLVGAVLGHLAMGYPVTMLSLIGVVALSGIVVNDSLILVDLVNRLRRDGMPLRDAVVEAPRRRLRAILLTSITTIAGLAPLMLERSFQAQFLIPMAISLTFGLAFATVLTLVVVPALYLILHDFADLARRLWGATMSRHDG